MKFRLLWMLPFLLITRVAYASGTADDFFRATGKIYVVIAVILIIFVGLFLYLMRLERRIHHLEKKIHSS